MAIGNPYKMINPKIIASYIVVSSEILPKQTPVMPHSPNSFQECTLVHIMSALFKVTVTEVGRKLCSLGLISLAIR